MFKQFFPKDPTIHPEIDFTEKGKSMKVSEAVEACGQIAVQKGFIPNDLRPLEQHALIATEIAEATEALRRGEDESREAEELVDVILRIMTYFYERGWDLDKFLTKKIAYNRTRPFRHGDKLH